jgi:hypothetical protein
MPAPSTSRTDKARIAKRTQGGVVADNGEGGIRKFLEELAKDPVEQIVVEYVIRELRNGRKLTEILEDPYVRNRLDRDRIDQMLAKPEVIDEVEHSVAKSFETQDFGFSD